MTFPTTLRLATIVLLALLLAPVPAAHGTERGAILTAEGSTSTMIDGVRVAASHQGERIVLSGTGFESREPIGLWDTFPDASVAGVDAADLVADDAGAFTIALDLAPSLPVGLHRFSARGRSSGHGAIVPWFLLPGGEAVQASARLVPTPNSVRQLETVSLAGQGFAANERVALWFTLPDGSVLALGELSATSGGTFDTGLVMPEWLPVGRYMVTARGVAGGATAIAELTLRHGNGLDIAGAEFAADIGRAKQRTRVEVKATGLLANEAISFWLTLPNGAVLALGDAKTDAQGNLDVDIYMSEALPTGAYYLSLRGNTSGLGSFARLVLEPGPKSPGEE
jgi:hypothetical protein